MIVRRWVFEVNAPGDEFCHHMKEALQRKGLLVGEAKVYDFSVRGFGARGYVKLTHHERGIEAQVKVKGVFGDVPALEAALLDAGRHAQTELLFPR
ncbi:MAG TPA: hypothetical protein VNZ52_13090 [Candidatus Thermoplasmatota archaeon]|nr:hypothetical protein [Candidatus Thermoplasmatota archaeon]